ncbi:histidine kinase [Arthrobacter sp. AL08]|uniref:sensor histidine kinase n=1 Tax=Micrococcaceae TaxID=1268 RepID=UPI00249BCE19|nr:MULTISPECIES: histidine kinase [Micrococcaceae]MDI3241379.1 histidine kinase [Arthrobacter sp. AL05]MDI3277364.1 histidine kinase [Arthrobacter sp. AL08]MDJ0354027.1 histidine kinase [Pseudarthrobacter sp. PH31-O2]
MFTATSWSEALLVAVGFLVTLALLRKWSLDGYPRQAILALMFTTASWIIGSLTASSPIGFVPVALIGALLLARTRRWRLWIFAFALSVTAVGASSFVFHPASWVLAAQYLVLPAVGTLFIVAVILLSEQAWKVVRRLERAQETEAELAAARERMRFAGDLHDIQGHSLHVIKLKAALGRRVVHTDPDRADVEFSEIRRLVDETIAETRALTYARYKLNLLAELENTKSLVEAAGVVVEVRFDNAGGDAADPLLAQVLREATTNLLRHARPTLVTISASPKSVEVINDGAADAGGSTLRGLARLRDRVEGAGGALWIEQSADKFIVSARIDPERKTTGIEDIR